MKTTTSITCLTKATLCGFLLSIFCTQTILAQANSITSGVTFNWADTQTSYSDPATLESITINGVDYNTFVVPSAYEMTRLGPGGHGANNIWENGTRLLNSSNVPTWDAEALLAYQSLNLNYYFESDNTGDNICGDFSSVTGSDSQLQKIYYSPGIPSNPDGVIAITERGRNNCYYIALYGTLPGETTEVLLGQAFVVNGPNATGIQPQSPPPAGTDYWLSGRNNNNGQIIGIALFELSSIAPIGSTITSIEFMGATNDVGDGKFLLMQTYAVDDIFDVDFETTFNGDVLWAVSSIIPFFDECYQVEGYTNILHDLTSKKLATIDKLTGLLNRRSYDEILTDQISLAVRNNLPISLAILDIDYFKRFNDSYGHPEGDVALKKVSSVLLKCLQRPSDFVFRIGGEEFAVLISGLNKQKIENYLNNIREKIQGLKIANKNSSVCPHLTISIGAVVLVEGALNEQALYKLADKALYEAKVKRNTVLVESYKGETKRA